MTTDDKINKLLGIVARLSKVVQQENELLVKPGNRTDLKPLLEEKIALSTVYEQHIQMIDEDSGLKASDPSLHRRLMAGIENFHALTEENCNRLLAKMEATRRVFSVIQKTVQDLEGATKTYSNSGSVQSSARRPFTPALSVGVNGEF